MRGTAPRRPVPQDRASLDTRGGQARERFATTESGAASGQTRPLTSLAPKDPFRSRGPRWILLFSLFSEEPHWLIPNDLVGALGAMPAAWLATVSRRCHSVDVFQRGRFLFPRQPLTSLLPKSQLHRTRGRLSFKDRLQESSLVYLCRFGGLTERAEVLREKPA
jgi:hypothetical protein